MADTNFFPDKEKENEDSKVQKKISDINAIIKKRLEDNNKSSGADIKSVIQERLQTDTTTEGETNEVQKKINERLIAAGVDLTKTKDKSKLSAENDSWLKTLPFDKKDEISRYLDIFRNNPEVVEEYIETLKKFGTVKEAKKAGTDNVLFYTNKVLKHISDNPEIFDEDTLTRWFTYTNPLQGAVIYDIAYREDDIGRAKQKEYFGKKTTKFTSALAKPVYSSMRGLTKTIALIADAVGPENAKSAVAWIEENWPQADDVTYPNKKQPFNQASTIQHLISGLAQFGIDTYLGGRLLKAAAGVFKTAAPGTAKKIAERVARKKPKLDRHGKEIADSFGNIHYVSSYAKNFGFWALPVKYGIGQALTDDTPQDMTGAEAISQAAQFYGLTEKNIIPPKDKEFYENMTKKERASYLLKRKLMHGAE